MPRAHHRLLAPSDLQHFVSVATSSVATPAAALSPGEGLGVLGVPPTEPPKGCCPLCLGTGPWRPQPIGGETQPPRLALLRARQAPPWGRWRDADRAEDVRHPCPWATRYSPKCRCRQGVRGWESLQVTHPAPHRSFRSHPPSPPRSPCWLPPPGLPPRPQLPGTWVLAASVAGFQNLWRPGRLHAPAGCPAPHVALDGGLRAPGVPMCHTRDFTGPCDLSPWRPWPWGLMRTGQAAGSWGRWAGPPRGHRLSGVNGPGCPGDLLGISSRSPGPRFFGDSALSAVAKQSRRARSPGPSPAEAAGARAGGIGGSALCSGVSVPAAWTLGVRPAGRLAPHPGWAGWGHH